MTRPRSRPARVSIAALVIFLAGVGALGLAIVWQSMGRSGQLDAVREPGPMRVVVTIPPLLWATRALAPPGAQITLVTPPGTSCSGVELTPSQVIDIRRADLLVAVGLGLESAVDQAAQHAGAPLRTQAVFGQLIDADRLIATSGQPHEHDGHACDHDHGGINPHVWLDPDLMIQFIERLVPVMRDAGARAGADAAWSDGLAPAADALIARARAIDEAYRTALGSLSRRELVVEHDAYAYLARRYGLDVAAVLRPVHQLEPTPADLAAAADAIRSRGVPAVFVEPQYAQEGARRIAALAGARVLELDPLGDGDWPAVMERNLRALVDGLSGAGPSNEAGPSSGGPGR